MERKSEVYTWRVSPEVKGGLEEIARRERRSVSRVLDEIVAEHLQADAQESSAEADQQRRLHDRAARFAGRLSGQDPDRAASARDRVRARLRKRSRGR
jgi:predicted transcriptional regulator